MAMANPPIFKGPDFDIWFSVFRMFVKQTEKDLWKLISQGPYELPKKRSKWTDSENQMFRENQKALNLMLTATDKALHSCFHDCRSAKDIMDQLKLAHRRNESTCMMVSRSDHSTSQEVEENEEEGVSVGPFCTIGSSVKLGNSCQMHPGSHIFGYTELGENCTVLAGAIVGADLPGRTIIGRNNIIGHHSVVGVKCQDMKYRTGDECFLHIGDNNDIREYTSVHRSSKSSDTTVIGNNNLIMGSCHIAHDCKIGSNNIFANNTLLAGHVVVEDYAHTAGAVVIHQFCHLGSHCFIGGGSVISQDVPKYMMVSGERSELRGLNWEGLRRHGFSCTEIQGMRRAYRKIFMPTERSSESIEDRLTEVEQNGELANIPAVCSMVKSIRNSFESGRRGICKFRNWLALE